MTDLQWKRALELYEAVWNLPLSAAEAQLTEMSDEPDVVREVTEMLRMATEAGEVAEAEQPTRDASVVIGRYEVLELLGSGSSGEVYAGRDRELGRPVALKFMSQAAGGVGSAGWRFLREAQAVSALNHPNIVTVHEVIAWDAAPIIVMELVQGKSLRALCSQAMPLETAQQIGLQIMQALAFVHASGIVHRDLKPENVIVRPDGYVKVLDFGLARRPVVDTEFAELASGSSPQVGTLRYMSPEQCRGEPASTASDVFAAGIVLYEMFAGRHPFECDSPLDTARAIATEQAQPPSRFNKDIPASIELLILRMLAKDPAARPSALEAEAVLAVQRTDAAAISKKRRLTGLAALAVVLIMGAAALLWFRHTAPEGPGPNLDIIPVAGMPGNERMPAISADGTKVAFEYTSANSPVSHIYLKDLSASSAVALTNDRLPDFNPVFSRDGTKLAFLRRDKLRLRVMVMPATGGRETQVAELSEMALTLSLLTWDAAGKYLIVSKGLGKPEVQVALFAIPVVGGELRQMTFPKMRELDCMAEVSPDGRTLGFARLDPGSVGRIWALPLAASLAAGGETSPWPMTGVQQIVSWDWSSGGRDLLIARQNGVRTSLWRQPSGGGTAVRVAGLDDQIGHLSVSQAGDHLVYSPHAADNISIWLYPAAASRETPRPVIASDLLDADARYSPDGQKIAFSSLREGDMGLWVCAKDGSGVRKLTFFEEGKGWGAGSASWSPDGRWIAFDAGNRGEHTKIYVIDAHGGKPRRLTGPGPETDAVPTWSPDGRWIYYASDRGGEPTIWKVPVSGGASVQVTHHPGFESTFTPDGQFLYYSAYGSAKPGLWRLSLVSGDDQPVPGLEMVNSRCWEGSRQGIYFALGGSPPMVKFFDFATQKIRLIRTMPVPPISIYRGLSISPDGQSLLYAQTETSRSKVMLVKNFR